MRVVTFRGGGGARLGVLRGDDEVVQVTDPGDMLALIDAGAAGLEKVRSAATAASRARAHRLADI